MRYTKCMKYLLVLFDGMLVIVAMAAVALGAYILHKEFGILDTTQATGNHGRIMYRSVIVAVAAVALGAYTLHKEFGILDTTQATGNRFYEVAAYLLFAASSLAVIVGMCGCLAARFENRCLAICHCLFLAAILILLGLGTVLAFYYRYSILHTVKDKMHEKLVNTYGSQKGGDKFITEFWDFIQRKLECCGLEGNINSTLSWSIYKRESEWHKQFSMRRPYIPTTCCLPESNVNVCTGIVNIEGPPKLGPPVTSQMASNPFMNTQGCYTAFIAFMDKYAIILAAVTLAILLLTTLAMLTSLCFYREIGRIHRHYAKGDYAKAES